MNIGLNKKNILAYINLFFLISALFVFFNTIFLTIKYYNFIPQGDEYEVIFLFSKVENFNQLIKYLFNQHNEHRTIITKIILILDIYFFHGLGVLNRIFHFISPIIIIIFIYKILFKEEKIKNLKFFILNPKVQIIYISIIILFSALQFENYVRGFNNQVFLVVLFSFMSLYYIKIFCEKINEGNVNIYYFLTSKIFLIFSTFTMSSGLITCILVPFYLIICLNKSRLKYLSLVISLIISITIIYIYFFSYSSPSGHPLITLKKIVNSFPDIIKFNLIFLGNIVGWKSKKIILFYGLFSAIQILLFVYLLKKKNEFTNNFFFFCLILNSICISLLVCLGRFNFSVFQGMSPRYITFTTLYWVSIIYLNYFLIDKTNLNSFFKFYKIITSFLIYILILIILYYQPISLKYFKYEFEKYKRAKISSSLNIFDDKTHKDLFGGPIYIVEDVFRYFEKKELNIYSNKLKQPKKGKFYLNENSNLDNWCEGNIENIHQIPNTNFSSFEGWAKNIKNNKKIDYIYVLNNGKIEGYAELFLERRDKNSRWDNIINFFNFKYLGFNGFFYNFDKNNQYKFVAASNNFKDVCLLNFNK